MPRSAVRRADDLTSRNRPDLIAMGGTYAVTGARLAIVPRESTTASRIFADGIALEPIEK